MKSYKKRKKEKEKREILTSALEHWLTIHFMKVLTSFLWKMKKAIKILIVFFFFFHKTFFSMTPSPPKKKKKRNIGRTITYDSLISMALNILSLS